MPDAEATLAPNETQCSSCDQLDNHPKHHYGDRRFHFDCLPDDVRADSFDHLPPAERKRIDMIIAHATADGVEHLHGHELRVKHVDLDPNQPAENKRALGLPVHGRAGARKATTSRTSMAKGKTRG